MSSHPLTGGEEELAGTKIQPLRSGVKTNTPLDTSGRGSIGSDHSIESTHLDPIGKGHHGHPHPHPPHPHMPHHEPHANSQGVVGREDVFASAKIEPFEGHRSAMYKVEKSPGLDDEIVDSSRIDPLSEEAREEM